MKKKKLNGLSLKKNVISKLNGSSVRGGGGTSLIECTVGTRHCDTNSADLPCFSKQCDVLSKNVVCGHTDKACDSIQVHCL